MSGKIYRCRAGTFHRRKLLGTFGRLGICFLPIGLPSVGSFESRLDHVRWNVRR